MPIPNRTLQAINSGIHVTASAGNANTLSSTQSPARAEAIITVGATDVNDAKASYSNYGPGVDIYAPGTNVLSSYIGGMPVLPRAHDLFELTSSIT